MQNVVFIKPHYLPLEFLRWAGTVHFTGCPAAAAAHHKLELAQDWRDILLKIEYKKVSIFFSLLSTCVCENVVLDLPSLSLFLYNYH